MNRIHPSPYSYGCLGVESTFRRQQMNAWWHHQMEAFSALLAFVWGIHRSPVNFPHKGQWRGTLVFSLICAWTNDWVNNRKAGDLRRHHAHYDVTVMAHVSSTGKLHDSLSSVWPLSLHVYWNRDKWPPFSRRNLKCIFFNENVYISIDISLRFVPQCQIYNIPALVQIMAWRLPDDKPLSEPMMASLLTHISVTRLQWVDACIKCPGGALLILMNSAY